MGYIFLAAYLLLTGLEGLIPGFPRTGPLLPALALITGILLLAGR